MRIGNCIEVTPIDGGFYIEDDSLERITVDRKEAMALRDWLNAEFPPTDCSCTPATIGEAVACMCNVTPESVTVEVVP